MRSAATNVTVINNQQLKQAYTGNETVCIATARPLLSFHDPCSITARTSAVTAALLIRDTAVLCDTTALWDRRLQCHSRVGSLSMALASSAPGAPSSRYFTLLDERMLPGSNQ